MHPKVSVLVPTYNREKFIRQAIDSILRQKYDNLEILISDNYSQDRTIEIINSFTDERIKVFRQDQNKGIFPNHNFLLHRATGDFIKYVHADDLLLEESIHNFVNIFQSQNNKVAYVAAASIFIDEQGSEKNIFPFALGLEKIWEPNELTLLSRRLGNIIGNPMSVMFRRESLLNVNFEEEYKNSADWRLLLVLSERFSVYSTKKALTKYRIHEGSLSHQNHLVLSTQWEDLAILSERNLAESDEEYIAVLWRQHAQIITRIFQMLKEGERTEAKENLNKLLIYDKGLKHYEQGICKADLQKILEKIDKGEGDYFGGLKSLLYGIISKTNLIITYEFYLLIMKLMTNKTGKKYRIKIIGYDQLAINIIFFLLRSFNPYITGIVNIYNNIDNSMIESIPVFSKFQYDGEDYCIIVSPNRMNDFLLYYQFQGLEKTFNCQVVRFQEWIL